MGLCRVLFRFVLFFLLCRLHSATSAADYDVVIVGGGISGMTAAYELRKQNPSIRLVVLEAGDRVGGRAWSVNLRTSGGVNERFDLGNPSIYLFDFID
jgi:flavin-dependent dehydrogenase